MSSALKVWIVLAALLLGVAHAQTYEPDIREINNSTELSFDGDAAFSLAGQGSLEFWAAVDWASHPGYDPVLFYSGSEEALVYSLSIAGDRAGVILQVGEEVEVFPYEFSDNQLHHFCVINLADRTLLVIDGQVRGSFGLTFPETTPTHFRIGSLPGANAAFIGAMGGVRWWSVAVELETLITYALASVDNADDPHPDLEFLTATSDLHNLTIEVIDDSDDEFEATFEEILTENEESTVALLEED